VAELRCHAGMAEDTLVAIAAELLPAVSMADARVDRSGQFHEVVLFLV